MLRRIVFGIIFALALLASGITIYYWNEIRIARAETPALVKQAFDKFGRKIVLRDVSQDRIDLLLKIEDPKFKTHRGVDLTTPGAGMTTITQGLVKLLYFPDGFTKGIAKIRQTLIAEYALDDLITKDQQLELYLNATYFGSKNGQPIHGLADAAEAYFQKPYTDLTDDEFTALIGMTISPNTLKPGTEKSATRVARIKRYLSGEVVPASVLDFEYVGKPGGSIGEEALMAFLRLITHADPSTIHHRERV